MIIFHRKHSLSFIARLKIKLDFICIAIWQWVVAWQMEYRIRNRIVIIRIRCRSFVQVKVHWELGRIEAYLWRYQQIFIKIIFK